MLTKDAIFQLLAECDIKGLTALFLAENPGEEAHEEVMLFMMHIARTNSKRLDAKARIWSHRWLVEHGWPSLLPDDLKAKAEQTKPRIVTAVGISVNFRDAGLKMAGKQIEKAMADIVADMYAHGITEPGRVKETMLAVGAWERKKLFGR